MTGTIFELLPNICTGKETNFRASYWHVVAATFETLMAAYFQSGGVALALSPFQSTMAKANVADTRRFCRTMYTEWEKYSPAYGIAMIRSCRKPYIPRNRMIPPAHTESLVPGEVSHMVCIHVE
jgi:hypothetical protein